MSVTNAEIDKLRKEAEKAEKALCSLYADLGAVACTYHKAINVTDSNGVYSDICDVTDERDSVEERINEIKGAVNALSEKDRHLELTNRSMSRIDERLETLISSLGAVATEMYSAGVLPEEFVRYMKPYIEYEKRLKDLEEKAKEDKGNLFSSLKKKKVERHRGSLNSVFSECGKRLYNSSALGQLPGERAEEICKEIFEIKEQKKDFRKNIGETRTDISKTQESLKSMGVLGEEKVTLRDLEERLEGIERELDKLYEQYGRIITPTMEEWLDSLAPEDLKKACNHVTNEIKHIKQQNLNIQYLEIEQQVEGHSSHKAEFDAQISQLESQKALIDRQIAELKSKSDIESRAISDLKQQQVDISIEFRTL